jgi:hypothetical protein
MAVTFEINGFLLDKKDVCKVMEGTEYSSAVTMRRLNIDSPGLHGQIPMWIDPLDVLKVTLRLRVLKPRKSAQTVLHNNVRLIQSLFRPGGYLASQSSIVTPLEIIRDRDGLRVRAFAQLETMSQAEYSHTGGFADMTVVLNIPRGVWESTTSEDVSFAANVNGQAYSTAAKTVLPFYPLVRVAGPFTSVQVRDTHSNTGVLWTRSPGISSGRFLLIDPYTMGAWDKATNGWDPTDPGTNDARSGLYEIGNGPLNATRSYVGTTPVILTGIDTSMLGGSGGTPITLRGRYTEP